MDTPVRSSHSFIFQIEDDEDLAERYKQKKMMEVEKNVTLMSIINQVGTSIFNFFWLID